MQIAQIEGIGKIDIAPLPSPILAIGNLRDLRNCPAMGKIVQIAQIERIEKIDIAPLAHLSL